MIIRGSFARHDQHSPVKNPPASNLLKLLRTLGHLSISVTRNNSSRSTGDFPPCFAYRGKQMLVIWGMKENRDTEMQWQSEK